jgi:transmembrane sensor
MSSLKSIEDQAAAWLARRDSGEWHASDEAKLTEWLEAATAHRVTFLRLERIWEEAGRLRVLAAGKGSGAVSSPETLIESPFFESRDQGVRSADTLPSQASPDSTLAERTLSEVSERSLRRAHEERGPRRILTLAAAAAVLLAIGVGAYLTRGPPRGEHFTTPVGGTESVPLADGSHITLNTATEVRVELSQNERHVNLEKGEAFFVVAKDTQRPFVVVAGNKRVIAVGTQFAVRRDGEAVEVVVTEGTVRMENRAARSGTAPAHTQPLSSSSSGSQLSSGSTAPEAVLLPAGTIARARDGDVLVEEHSLPQVEEALSWREGYLTFHETTLAEAVSEFNRYNDHKIRISDPAVAAIRISGTFRPTNYEAFVRLLQDGFSIQAVDSQDGTALTVH